MNPIRSHLRTWAASRPSRFPSHVRASTLFYSTVRDMQASEQTATGEPSTEQPSSPSSSSQTIHILGLGNIGLFIANALSNSPNPPPITLLSHTEKTLSAFTSASSRIEFRHPNGTTSSSSNYQTEFIQNAPPTPITNLIVATKAPFARKAVESVRSRLGPKSTILFTQNGMGTVEEVIQDIFPEQTERPGLYASVIAHGIYSTGQQFRPVHAGVGFFAVGKASEDVRDKHEQAQYFLTTVLQAPILNARWLAGDQLLFWQLEKLMVNAVINPLTAVFNCKNGELFDKPEVFKLMEILTDEGSQVFRRLPEVRNDPVASERFSPARLRKRVLEVAEATAQNISSMLQDVRNNRVTEIDYINGWIVKKGREFGIQCNTHEALVRKVANENIGFLGGVGTEARGVRTYFPATSKAG